MHLGRRLRGRGHAASSAHTAAVRAIAGVGMVALRLVLVLGMAVGRGRAVSPLAVERGCHAGGAEGRGHLDGDVAAVVAVMMVVRGGAAGRVGAVAAKLVLAAVRRGHDGGRDRGARGRDVAADALLRGLVVEQLRAAVARGRAAVLDALALHAHGGALEDLAVELGNGNLGHVRLGKLDEGHGANCARL